MKIVAMSLATHFLQQEIESGRFSNNNFSCFGAKKTFGFRRQCDAHTEAKHRYHNCHNIEFHIPPFNLEL
jgi:hypothetical protein